MNFRRMRSGAAVSTAALAGAVLLAGCTTPEEKPQAKAPARVCWDAFAGSEVEPFLPPGEEVKDDAGELFQSVYAMRGGTARQASLTCVVYVDGNTHFLASVQRQSAIGDLDWSTWKKGDWRPLDVGEEGVIWNSLETVGTVTYFFCGKPDSRDKIELRLDGSIRDDLPRARRLLTDLTKKYLAFAQKELGCSAAPDASPSPQ